MGEQVGARFYGDIAQLGEHLPCKQGVRGSNPLISTVPSDSQMRMQESTRTYLENRILNKSRER